MAPALCSGCSHQEECKCRSWCDSLANCGQVDYVDIWTNHTPYPFNQLPKTYSFMVRNSLIWRVGYYGQQPRFIHVPTQTISSLFVSRQVGAAFDHYQPDLVVSVHPLMQLVPLRVLRQQARCAQQQLPQPSYLS